MNLTGFSVAGMETCIEVPALKLVLDMGRCSRTAAQHPLVLLSHGHIDHMGGVAHHAARRSMMSMSEGVYLVPKAVAPAVEAFFNAAGALDGQTIARRIVPLEPGEEFSLGKNRWVRPFETFHRVASQGYTIWERRHRLREEFRGKEPAELGALRRQGVPIEDAHEVPILSFTGDTRIEVLERCEELQRTETLVLETTFLDARVSVDEARAMGHIHLNEVASRSDLLPTADVVFTHFSARYSAADIASLIEQALPEGVRERVRILAAESPA